eukprot:6506018-Prymnesium_polylepis.1
MATNALQPGHRGRHFVVSWVQTLKRPGVYRTRCRCPRRLIRRCLNGSFNIRTRQGGCEQVGH